ncbi:hypothetical protein ALC57_10976 [Trachymyrmex cornetzi]|uniref:Uncharacterized protein n=1 Tax=Trachymyrmex cornetzi TaxID=471704 RepID=A0A195DW42_9HYME|nr:hypothetical protein ALC57_10976 [Trachymyrmex cornetzi]
MVEGRADDRSKKSSRCEYVIRNRPRHTATDRRRSGSARALSSPFLASAPNLHYTYRIHFTLNHNSMTSHVMRKKEEEEEEEEEEEKVAKEEGGGARQAGEQAFSVHRKISQPGRGPMPVNSVGRSLTSSNSNGYATGFFTVCQEALARGVHSPDAAIRNRKEASRGRHDSSRFPYEKLQRSVEKFTVKRPLKQRYLAYSERTRLPEKEIEKAASRESCHVAKNIILKTWNVAKDHSSNKTAQVTTTSVLWWQRTFDDVGHKNRLRAPNTLRYEAPISGCLQNYRIIYYMLNILIK